MPNAVPGWPHPPFIKVLIGNRDDEMAAGLDDSNPVLESDDRVSEVLKAVAGVEEVEAGVFDRDEVLGVPVDEIPLDDLRDAGEQPELPREPVRTGPNIQTSPNKVSSVKGAFRVTAGCRL